MKRIIAIFALVTAVMLTGCEVKTTQEEGMPRSQHRRLGRADPRGGERKEIWSRKPGNKVEGEIPSVG